MEARDVRDPLSGRAAAIRDAARDLLEHDGPGGLAMRPLAERVGVHPPAVYRHFPDKRAVERAVVDEAFWEIGDALLEARERGDDALAATCGAYRHWALEHPHLFRLVYSRPSDPLADPDAAQHAGRALREVAGGDRTAARAVWACAHGLTILELDGRLPDDTDVDGMWAFALDALRRQLEVAGAIPS